MPRLQSPLCLFACLLLFACRQELNMKPSAKKTLGEADISFKRPSQNYISYADSIRTELQKLQGSKYTSAIQKLIYHSIADDMPLYWNGTKWDFNGTTRTPGHGSIACGYFLTTVLSDLGLKVQRSWLAQQPSSVLIKATCSNINRYTDLKGLKKYLATIPRLSICIVGLDFHTGFIVKADTNSYFFHSNYINKNGVVKELIDESRALKASKSFMIGDLTGNADYLLR